MAKLKTIKPEQLVFQLKILIEDSSPAIFRTLQVPVDTSFHDLHLLIQQAFAWQNQHLYEFTLHFDNRRYLKISSNSQFGWERDEAPSVEDMPTKIEDGVEYIEQVPWFGDNKTVKIRKPVTLEDFAQIHYPEFIMFDSLDSQRQSLMNFVRVGQVFDYIYDFGDNWTHQILCESLMVRQKPVRYPIVTDGQGNHLFEDCGGIGGYYCALAALHDPKHEEHQHIHEWLVACYGKSILKYDPNQFDISKLKLK